MFESLCFALLSRHVLFNGLFYQKQTSVEMSLHLVLSVIILHQFSELNAPREDIRFLAAMRQRWIVNQKDRQVAGGDSPHVPLHSCCQQQDGLGSLCYLESLTQQGNSIRLHYDEFTHKCRGSVSKRGTCFVIL